MGRFWFVTLLTAIVLAAFWQVNYRDRFDIIAYLKRLGKEERVESPTVREQAPVSIDRDIALELQVHPDRPLWRENPERQRVLVEQRVVSGGPEGQFRNPVALAYDEQGALYILDHGNKSIEKFDRGGRHLNTIGVSADRKRFLKQPTDLVVGRTGVIYVADREAGVVIFEATGTFRGYLPQTPEVTQVAMTSRNELIFVTPAAPYLLHRMTSSGKILMHYARQSESDTALRQALSPAWLALDTEDATYVSFQHPYRVLKFDADGRPVTAFARELPNLVPPPTIQRDSSGRVQSVFRKQVSFDLAVDPDNLIYNLVRAREGVLGDTVDIFSSQGAYVLSLYLKEPGRGLAIHDDTVAVISAGSAILIYSLQ